MDPIFKARQTGKAVILCALILRMFSAGIPAAAGQWISNPRVISFLIYLETGRTVRSSVSPPEPEITEPEVTAPAVTEPEHSVPLKIDTPREIPIRSPEPDVSEPPPIQFTAEDLEAISLVSSCGEEPDLEALLTQPLNLSLTAGVPTVLILHTHATESYTPAGEKYTESSDFRTLDENFNMISIGQRTAELLEAGGITVLHDRTLHDYPSYNGAYSHARSAIRDYLERNPSIQLVLDLHRDAAGESKNQLRTKALSGSRSCAQLMLVMGAGNSGAPHKNWQQNLSLALKLTAQLERQCPGITRPISLRAQRFNQDLSPGALLVEVGAAGNTRQEALLAAEQLAAAILALKDGCSAGE